MKQKFNVSGMTCSACSAHVEKSVAKTQGVQSVEVSLLTNSMQVVYDEAQPIRPKSFGRWNKAAMVPFFPPKGSLLPSRYPLHRRMLSNK